jgi:hypothetical protein
MQDRSGTVRSPILVFDGAHQFGRCRASDAFVIAARAKVACELHVYRAMNKNAQRD